MVIKSTKLQPYGAIGKRLLEQRKKSGLNQTKYGDLIGVTQKTQSLYEKGERCPDAEYLKNISLKTDADIQYIVTGFYSSLPQGDIDEQLLAGILNQLHNAIAADETIQKQILKVAEKPEVYKLESGNIALDLSTQVRIATRIYNRVHSIENQDKRNAEIKNGIDFAISIGRNTDLL